MESEPLASDFCGETLSDSICITSSSVAQLIHSSLLMSYTACVQVPSSSGILNFPSATLSASESGYLYLPQGVTYPGFPSADGLWTGFDPSLMALQGFGQLGAADPQMLASPAALQNPQMLLQGGALYGQDMYIMSGLANSYLGGYPGLPSDFGQTSVVSTDGGHIDSTLTNTLMDPMVGLGTALTEMTLSNSGIGATLPQPSSDSIASTSVVAHIQENGEQTPSVVDPPITSTHPTPAGLPVEVADKKVSSAPDKPMSWAAVAKQPPKPVVVKPPPPPVPQVIETHLPQASPGKQRGQNGKSVQASSYASLAGVPASQKPPRKAQGGQEGLTGLVVSTATVPEIVKQLHLRNQYNPHQFSLNLNNARYFVIKSYAEDDIHRSIKYNVWTSTEHGNRRLDQAYREQNGKANIFLFFSVNGSGHFCGVAQMMSEVDLHVVTGIFAQEKWKGKFSVKWIYVKDVPNGQLRHIRLENNENKPVTNSRDTQEVPPDKGRMVMKIVHSFQATSSIFDDFQHYENKQLEDKVGRTL